MTPEVIAALDQMFWNQMIYNVVMGLAVVFLAVQVGILRGKV